MSAPPEGGQSAAEPQQVLFNHLLFSARQHPRRWASGTTLTSVLIHVALFGAAAYGTTGVVIAEAGVQELVTYVDVQEEKRVEVQEEKRSEQLRPQPEPPGIENERPSDPPPLLGTQTLTPPTEAPAEIPEVDLSAPAVRAEDYSGLGPIGGVADGIPGGVPVDAAPAEAPTASESAFAYELEELERMPQLLNGPAMAAGLKRLYPPVLQRSGVGGTVVLKFVVEPSGSVDLASVQVLESPHEQLNDASIRAIENLRFRPGRFHGQNVRVWIQMPITWVAS
jgi:periplasmic protein TonB